MRGKLIEDSGGDARRFRPFDWLRDMTASVGLTGKGAAVAAALLTMQRKGEVDGALMQTIAERAHLSLRSAERGLVELRKAGLVRVRGRFGSKGRIASAFTLLSTGAWAAMKEGGARQYDGNVPANMAGFSPANMAGHIQETQERRATAKSARGAGVTSTMHEAARAAALSASREAPRAGPSDSVPPCRAGLLERARRTPDPPQQTE